MNDVIKQPEYEEPALAPTTGSHDLAQAYGTLPRARFKSVPRIIAIKVTDDATAITTGDGKFIFEITEELDGAYLIGVRAFVSTVSASGGPVDIQIRNITDSVDLLSTSLKIDDSEYSSDTAATPAVISLVNSMLSNRDRIAIDIDDAGSGAKGLLVYLTVQ